MDPLNYFYPAGALILAWGTFRLTVLLLANRTARDKRRKEKAERLLRKITIVLALLFAASVILGGFGAYKRWKMNREAEAIKHMLREAEIFELRLYNNPKAFDPHQTEIFWVKDSKASKDIACAVQHLIDENWYYGSDSKLESFEFDSVQITGDRADASTREAWYLPLYSSNDNERVKGRKAEQSWKATYYVRLINGKWLIEDTTLPYKPCPAK
jgi:hypothetical protein